MEGDITFEENMHSLLKLKLKMQNLYNTYSPDIVNVNHLVNVEDKTKMLWQIHNEMEYLKTVNYDQRNKMENQLQQYEEENENLKQNANDQTLMHDQLKHKNQELENQLTAKQNELEFQMSQQNEIIKKYKRELENAKLKHEQEIYLIKQRNKKNN